MLNIETIREHCLKKQAVTESFPFDNDTLVFKVAGKIFALLSLDGNFGLNLKCNPEKALELREQYSDITPGYHMNKTHWNTLNLDGNIKSQLVFELIDHSYKIVTQSLTMKTKKEFNLL
ncbi:MAG: MmcQ/YjbR family DNA-binding protein [Bacteroidetes bacterium]|nr:MmcQ/YjbR family DNA-binding protein [Bacteroidota bacterium]PIX32589.1 MAG: MmcQ-like protein [Bacteroidetes bacterium CG_4_8_14_3_um_filter_31_14]